FQRFAANIDDFAIGQHHLHAQDVVGGHTVFEAVRAAGVERNVAADGAHNLRTGIGRVVQAVRRHFAAHPDIDHARLHDHTQIFQVDFQDFVHLGQNDQQPAGDGQ